MPEDKWFIVELRCGTCGLIFCGVRKPVREHKVVEYVDMFKAQGPARYPQCVRKCPTTSQDPLRPNDPNIIGNQNQKVVTARFYPQEMPRK